MWKILPILATGLIANVTMDEIRHHWSRWFGKVVKRDFWKKWMNPSLSFNNKWKIHPALGWLFSTALVWVTDFWHFLKAIMLNSFFLSIIILLDFPILWGLVMANVGWGILYETTRGTYGLLSDRIKIKEGELS